MKMKKVLLGLAMAMLMLSMVGCSTEDKNNISSTEQTTNSSEETKEVVNGLTGEKETIVEEEQIATTIELYAKVTQIVVRELVSPDEATVHFEYMLNDEVYKFTQKYPVGTFVEGDVVKFTMGTLGRSGMPDIQNVISWEKVEE